MTKLDWARQLSHGSITADDILVVMANTDFVTAGELDRRSASDNVCTPWALGFVDASGELIEGLEEFEWFVEEDGTVHDNDWWEQNWGGRA